MKKTNIVFALLLLTLPVGGQSFSGKTNDIFLNFKDTTNRSITVALPFITWKTPSQDYTNSTSYTIIIEASVFSTEELKSVLIEIGDGTAIRGTKTLEINHTREYSVQQQVNLIDGLNVIQIVAENINGGKIASSKWVLVGSNALEDAVSIDRKDYALLFATDKYDNWTDLVNPIDDAYNIAKILHDKYGFETEVVENPNLDDVFIKLAEYAQRKFKPQDQLLIFFAGHGYFDENFGEGFVVAKNSLQNDRAKTSYISHNRLRGVVSHIPSEHIFLAMDVCFGGTFDPVIARARGTELDEATNSEFLVRKLSRRTRKYLTSGGKEYVSDGVPGRHSPFALKILQALSEGGGGDHILTLSELKAHLEKLKSEPRFGSFGDDKSDSDFVFVAKN